MEYPHAASHASGRWGKDCRRSARGVRHVGLREASRDMGQGLAGAAAPGSQQDFVVNVGDRVFFESDSTELTVQSRATLDKQAQWLQTYNRNSFTVEGHADERGTREYNIALGARRAQTVRDYLVVARHRRVAHAHDFLRQGTAGRGLQRHFLLVAKLPRGHRAQRQFVRFRLRGSVRSAGAGNGRRPCFTVSFPHGRLNAPQSQFRRSFG